MEIKMGDKGNQGDDFTQEVNVELEQTRRSLREVSMMLEQSQVEVTKLTQRNAAITGHLQQVQAQFDSISREDIRMAYNSALDAQQRLYVMRGQLEKLQGDQANLQKLLTYLEKMRNYLADGGGGKAMSVKGQGNVLDMLIRAQEDERLRLSKQMHDGPAQALSNFIVQTEIASRFFDMDAAKAKEELSNLKNAAMDTFQKVRRFIYDLRPMILDDLGLLPTLRRQIDSFKEQTGVDVHLVIQGQERRLDNTIEIVVFRAVQELMGNAARHNENQPVKITINVQVVLEAEHIRASVSDNGKGFDMDEVEHGDYIGLKIIRERVEMLGGKVDIETGIGRGCKIELIIPCAQQAR